MLEDFLVRECCQCIVPTIKQGALSVMVWGCFCNKGVGILSAVEETMKQEQYLQILNGPMVTSGIALFQSERYIFQQDNAPCHKARRVILHLEEMACQHNFTLMCWPPQSPDLNPIENMWAEIKRRLQISQTSNKEKLYNDIKEIWYSLDAFCTKLIDSMPARVQAVLRAKGGPSTIRTLLYL